MTAEEVCATSGHMPSGPRLGVPEVRCLCGGKRYRRVVPDPSPPAA
jgi:hypothetical protein